MKILSNKEYEKIINKEPQSYTYYMKDPYQAKKIEELESQNIRLEIESDKKDKKIKRLNNIINEAINYTTKQMKKYEGYDRDFEIVLSNIVVMLGSDKE